MNIRLLMLNTNFLFNKKKILGKNKRMEYSSDINTGFWIQDGVYTFETNVRPDPLDVGHGKRVYSSSSNSFFRSVSKCPQIASNMFQRSSKNKSEQLRKEGRNYYETPQNILNVNIITNTPKVSFISKSLFGLSDISLYSLICSQFTRDLTDNELNALVLYLSQNSNNLCTQIGSKIAKSLITVASTRIFADPEQSILELPVNSIDSYLPEYRVGKFGMGFFSFLYWLIDHPQRYLQIDSYSKTNDGVYDVVYTTYSVRIFEKNGNLSFRLTTFPFSKVTQTGTRIELNTQKDPISLLELSNFSRQIYKLHYIKNVSIKEVLHDGSLIVSNISDSNLNIYYYLSTTKIFVEDFAQGIPLNILFTSLFVPSISTKGLSVSVDVPFVNQSGVSYDDESELLITVNNVIVNVTTVSVKDYYNQEFLTGTFRIDLPANTRLPVARDDIILNETTIPVFVESCQIVLRDALNKSLQPKKELYEHKELLYLAQKLFLSYGEKTASPINSKVIKEVLHQFNENHIQYYVSQENINILKILNNYGLDIQYAGSIVYNTLTFEKNLKIAGQTDIYENVNVIILPVPETGMYGFNYHLFVSSEYANQNLNWIDDLPKTFTEIKLKPYLLKPIQNYLEYYLDIIEKRIEGLRPLVEIYPKDIVLEYFTNIYENFDKELFEIHVNSFLSQTLKVKGNRIYGGKKYKVQFIPYDNFKLVNKLYKAIPINFLKDIFSITFEIFYEKNIYFFPEFYPISIFRSNFLFWKALWEQTPDIYSIYYISRALEHSFVEKISKIPKDKQYKIAKLLIQIYLESPVTNEIFIDDIRYSFTNPIIVRIKQVIASIEIHEKFPKYKPFEKLNKTKDFTLLNFTSKQLIRYLFEKNINISNINFSILKEVSKIKNTLPLQILEIAINEGTVKDIYSAILTELTQNSIDAIRSVQSLQNTIQYEVDTYKLQDKYILKLQVSDEIGMTLQNFISLSIPFLSTKTPSETVTGEMGTGFFNLYRYTTQVKIDTCKNNYHIVSIETPVEDFNGRVIDIQKQVIFEKCSQKNGTSITFISKPFEYEEYIKVLTNVLYTIKNVIALINEDIAKIYLIYNKKKTQINVYTTKEFIVEHKDIPKNIKVRFMPENYHIESYVMTKNIPFMPLKSFFNLETPRGFIVNIPGDLYTPIQSRTSIRLKESNSLDILQIYLFNFYVFFKISIGDKIWQQAIPQFNSKVDLRLLGQINFELAPIMGMYIPNKLGNNAGIVLQNAIDISILNKSISKGTKYLQQYASNSSPYFYRVIRNVLIQWLENKKIDQNVDLSFKQIELQKSSLKAKEREFLKIMKIFVDVFVHLAKNYKINGYENISKISVFLTNEPILGIYNSSKNAISFNYNNLDRKRTLLSILKEKNYNTIQSYIGNVCGYQYPASTLFHELEHARRKSSHSEGGHNPTSEPIFPNEIGKLRDFDESANDVAKYLIDRNYYETVFEEMRLQNL